MKCWFTFWLLIAMNRLQCFKPFFHYKNRNKLNSLKYLANSNDEFKCGNKNYTMKSRTSLIISFQEFITPNIENIKFISLIEGLELKTKSSETSKEEVVSINKYYPLTNIFVVYSFNASIRTLNYSLIQNIVCTDQFKVCSVQCEDCFFDDLQKERCNGCSSNYYPLINDLTKCFNDNTKESNYILNGNYYNYCHNSCANCTSIPKNDQMNCIQCKYTKNEKYYKHREIPGQCYKLGDKPTNRLMNRNQFENCFKSCATCSEVSTDNADMKCIICDNANKYYKHQEKPTQCYKEGENPTNTILNGNQFENCFVGCATCDKVGTDNNDMKCTTCDTISKYFKHKEKPTQCYKEGEKPIPKIFYNNELEQFENCYETCETCKELGNNQNSSCLSCIPPYYPMINQTNHCFDEEIRKNSYPGYILNTNLSKYEPCYNSCSTCLTFGGNSETHYCTPKSCNTDHYPLCSNSTQCYNKDNKPSGYFFSIGSDQFELCNESCQECEDLGPNLKDTKCTKCLESKQYYPLYNDSTVCTQANDMGENYFLDSSLKQKVINICYDYCKTCSAKGEVNNSKCDSCIKDFYPLKADPKNCFNNETIHKNYYFTKDNKYDRCYEACGTCYIGGTPKETNCDSCAEGYHPFVQKVNQCYNQKTKPDNTELNENEEYQDCSMNIQCPNKCPDFIQRWYKNEIDFIKCIEELKCIEDFPFYYAPTNRCLNKCPNNTYHDTLTNYCIHCDDSILIYPTLPKKTGINKYLYNNMCLSKCPDGYEPDLSNICVQCENYYENGKCVDACSSSIIPQNKICHPCNYYYSSIDNTCVKKCSDDEDYDKSNKCFKNILIDSKFKLKHNPIDYYNEIYWYYNNQSLSSEYLVICNKVLNNMKKMINIKEKNDYLILLTRMINSNIGSTTVSEIESINNQIIEVYTQLLMNQNNNISYDDLLHLFLADYYILANNKYISQKNLDQIKNIQLSIFEIYIYYTSNSPAEYQKSELLTISLAIYDMINQAQFKINQYNTSYSSVIGNDLYTKIINTFISTNSTLLSKSYTDDYTKFLLKNNQDKVFSQESFETTILTIPLNYVPSVPNFPIQGTVTCSSDKEIIKTMNNEGNTVTVCIPKHEILAKYPEAKFIAIIKYSYYPLLNNQKSDFSSEFIGVDIYSQDYAKIKIKDFRSPFKIYIKTKTDSKMPYKYCFYFNEKDRIPAADCSSLRLQDHLICSTTHLTDFSASMIDVHEILEMTLLIFRPFKIINSLLSFQLLNYYNAYMLYIMGGLVIFYLLLLPLFLFYDYKNYKNYFYELINEKNETKSIQPTRNGILILKKELGKDQTLNSRNKYQFKAVNIERKDCSNDVSSLNNSKKEMEIINISKSDINKVNNPNVYCRIFRLFIYHEYRLIYLFTLSKNMLNKTDQWLLFVFRKLMLLMLCSMTASCQLLLFYEFRLQSMDYFAIFGNVILVDIVSTIFEIALERIIIDTIENSMTIRKRTNAIWGHTLVYAIIVLMTGFGFVNTLWISLEVIRQDLVSMMIYDYIFALVFDLAIYEFIILGMKALIYYIIIKNDNNKTSNNNKCIESMKDMINKMNCLLGIKWFTIKTT